MSREHEPRSNGVKSQLNYFYFIFSLSVITIISVFKGKGMKLIVLSIRLQATSLVNHLDKVVQLCGSNLSTVNVDRDQFPCLIGVIILSTCILVL